MALLFIILSVVLGLYFLYPLYLLTLPRHQNSFQSIEETGQPVSVILLTYNGINHVREKILLLFEELNDFKDYELIIVDDHSKDGTMELLKSLKEIYSFKLVLKDTHRGIPHSMNMSANMAKHEIMIFCDQRQKISRHAMKNLIKPFGDETIGAVSASISCFDIENNFSWLRRHENFIKQLESSAGYLVGVYGPLYAIKKSLYEKIGENIILDDLYLSLKIMAKKKIILCNECLIYDEDFVTHYHFERSRRYLKGLIQLLHIPNLIGNLPFKLAIMLIWHKFLRLFIPPLVLLCYLASSFFIGENTIAAIIFLSFTLGLIISIFSARIQLLRNIGSLFRVNFYYVFSMLSLFSQKIIGK